MPVAMWRAHRAHARGCWICGGTRTRSSGRRSNKHASGSHRTQPGEPRFLTPVEYSVNTTVIEQDFVEVTEDLSGSSLWNKDLAPTPLSRRTWSTYNIAALWIGMSVVITTYTLASGLMAQGMPWWQAMFTILLGNTIVLVPMVLNAHAGTRYGISFPVLC